MAKLPGLKSSVVFPWLFVFSLLLPLRAEVEIKVIQSVEDLPSPFSTLARKGDIFISDGNYYFLIGASPRPLTTSANYPHGNAMGNILSFVPSTQRTASDLNIGGPVLRIKDRTRYVVYSRLEEVKSPTEDKVVFRASGAFEDREGRKAGIETAYAFYPQEGRVDITSTLTNTGKVAFENLSYSLFFDAYARYSFNPYHEKKFPGLNFRVYQKKGHSLGWVNWNPVEKEEKRYPGRLAPGEKVELRYSLLSDSSSRPVLRKIYAMLGQEPVRVLVAFEDFDGDWMELVVREALSSAVFFRAILEKPLLEEILLLPGVYRFQAHFFPASVEELAEVKSAQENSLRLKNPAHGTVTVKIRDSQGNHVPGKVTFLGIAPTRAPYFRPDNPVETGRGWESFKNSCYPGEDGLDVNLPVGTYLVYASRGPEFTLDQKIIEVTKGDRVELVFIIDKVVATPGLISLDPHMHTRHSDGTVTIEERLRSVVAEGIEVAVATDHNLITDYSGPLRKLKLDAYLAVFSGNEITTPDVLHFNAYPLLYRPDEEQNGAINSAADEAGPLFKASREKDPEALLQVNHPRAGDLGYFNNLALDLETAAHALPGFSTDFDLLEVVNGPYFYASNQVAIEDWFHLLNRGYYFPLVGSSDSHTIDRGEPGYSRTYVYYSGEKASRLNQTALFQALREGHSFATNGPLIDLKVNGRARPGDLVTAKDGHLNIRVEVRSAPWVDVAEVRLIFNGERRVIFPVRAKEYQIVKFEQEIGLTVKEDTFLCAEVLGQKTLFPVLQLPSRTGLLEDGTLPYALTNPVFIDVDGNGKFDHPLARKIELKERVSEKSKKISR